MNITRIMGWMAVLLPLPCSATTYYVSNAGSDSNAGTSVSRPWATISKVNHTKLLPGDVVQFQRSGTWLEEIQANESGTAEAPILYTAYGNGQVPIISGSGTRAAGINMFHVNFVTVKYLAFTDAADGVNINNSNNILVYQCQSYRNSDRGISISGTSASNLEIVANAVFSNVNDGIVDFANGNAILIQSNIVHDNVSSTLPFGAGIRVVGYDDSQRPTGVRVIDNTVFRNGFTGSGKYNTGNGMHLDTMGDGLVVYGNTVYDNQQFGIQVEWSGTHGTHQILNNTVYDNKSLGLVIYRRSWNVLATGNVVYGNLENCVIWGEYGGNDPVGMHNNTFSNNWCYAPAAGGISFSVAWGANNDGKEGAGNVYQNNCLGVDGPNHFQYGTNYYAALSSLLSAAGGAVTTSCSNSELAAEGQ